ncbi:DEAD/DEAH box helicase [Paenibacillus andongensis]|uniref:DEAD/DEAH box helicase n=1 Tax=Paenibacillus andongensis TaxID=2975482 RepID=UPI0021BBB11E|nr:DEAD/DEAH box helicase [Paenibacillus andongensis]
MSLFKRFFGNEKNDEYRPIQIKKKFIESGLSLALVREGVEELVRFPLNLTITQLKKETQLENLEILETLWYDELLHDESDGYHLQYTDILKLPSEVREFMGILDPEKPELLLGHEGAVGTSRFQFVLHKSYGQWRNVEQTSKIVGPWVALPDGSMHLLDPDTYEIDQMIRNSPDPRDAEQIFSYVAEVRNRANRLGIPLDTYLERQEYLFVDNLELQVEYDNKKIHIQPAYVSNEIDPTLLESLNDKGARFAVGAGREKVFVDPRVWEHANKIKEVPPIQGDDIPRFAENPEAFIPDIEGLDLSLFGERVKSLGIRVYRAQPFVHAKPSERGWFQIETGFSAVDETGEIWQSFKPDEFQALIRQARDSGNEYFEWNGNWLRIPPEVDDFIRSTGEVHKQFGEKPMVDITSLPYILEIYENIGQLEFNAPILQAHQELRDQGVLDRTPPGSFQATLKAFQQDGYVWMKMLHFRKWGGLLADDMGLGKTIQVISLLSYLQQTNRLTPTLIVVPKTLIDNWEKEMTKFAPFLLPSLYLHRGTDRIKSPEALRQIGITITTYHTLVRDQLVFGQVEWQAIICDEAQAIKNPSTAASHVLKAMKSKFRLAMTGTPVENGLSELWSIMDYVQPGLLGSLSEFKREFITPLEAGEGDSVVEQRLLAKLSYVYKRRTKSEELAGQLPPKHHHVIQVPLGDVQKRLYAEIIELVKSKMMDGLQAIQRLKLLSSHPGLIAPEWINLPPEMVPKLLHTLQIIDDVKSKGEKVLIFTEYLKMQDILKSAIRDRFGIIPFVINGMTDRRQLVVDEFNRKPGFDVLILSPKAAGTGLTITSANHVIHYTRWWNPAVENQATDRAYRIGQDKPVHVYCPIVTDNEGVLKQGTVEEIVHRILSEKQELASSIIVSSRKLDLENEILQQFSKQ